ncbi:MAG: energy-coupling factor transporter transmembrane protein EcfT [Anaerolineae bacterium]|jgi:energy-coupling factor transport system permease protein|nr:energy-coupling factor transporter transmembrane protein EcfT [Anaerolineae bacterium]MDH7475072.1 energy-coupling factor transporter transmembrane component T [Anaerolineae bacterium]
MSLQKDDVMFHPIAWLLWLGAAVLPVMLSQNPLYVGIVCLAAGIVYMVIGRYSPLAQSWSGFLKLGLTIIALTVPFNALSVHAGRLVIFTLPRTWPLVGGPITGEAVIFGASKALSLFTLLLLFAVFNCAVDQARLLRWTPAFLFEAGLVTSIALTFVPQMLRSMQEIYEAQAIRGHRFRGIRDLLPLFVPLLTSGLERAMQLAESMETRGFGGSLQSLSPRREVLVRIAAAVALLGLVGGFFTVTYFREGQTLSWTLLVLSVTALTLVFRIQSQRVRRTRYRHGVWHRQDTVLAAISVGLAVIILLIRSWARVTLSYYPYPPFSPWPPFNPVLGVALTVLVAPAMLAFPQSQMTNDQIQVSND